MVDNQMVAIPEAFNPNDFWQLWQEYRDYLYARCLKWMGGNPMEAEDALSRAMLKAWEKVQQYAGKISNLKAWLTRLTHNLCVDIHREHSRGANRVEDIEAIPEEKGLVFCEDTPLRALETEERKIVIRGAIDNLPIRLRETFILHFYHQYSHQEIAQQQDISYANVCKRISQGRKILRKELRGYFRGNAQTDREELNKTEDVLSDLSISISAVGDRNQREALRHQAVSKVSPGSEDEQIEELSQDNVKSESLTKEIIPKFSRKEDEDHRVEELLVQKNLLVSHICTTQLQNINKFLFFPPIQSSYQKLVTAMNISPQRCMPQENPIKAEDVQSQAMLKAWEKVQQYAGKITNSKAWLTRLTHNLRVHIHREHSRDGNRVEDIEAIPESKR